MNPACHGRVGVAARRRRREGISLIVMITVAAIVAIFSLVLLRALLREIDVEVARKEAATLQSHRQALEGAILSRRIVPAPTGATDWASFVAAELGVEATAVATNPRHQSRTLLVDTNNANNGWLQPGALPYIQTAAGLTNKPTNARLMLVSSLGQPLPNLGNYPSATEFSALWDCREGQVPSTTAWSGWNGRPGDIKVERIPLDPLFLELRLVTSRNELHFGRYAIGATTPVYEAPVRQPVNPPRYLLRGTPVWLFATNQVTGMWPLDARMILNKNAAYRYEDEVWKGTTVGADFPGGLDLAAVVKGFLEATPNTNAMYGAQQQAQVTGAMMDFMRGYMAWGKAGFPSGGRAGVLSLQNTMMDRCQGLFNDAYGGKSYFPINGSPCE